MAQQILERCSCALVQMGEFQKHETSCEDGVGGGGGEVQLVRPVAAGGGSLIGSSNNNDNNNQHLKTIHNQANTKELLCRTITIRVNRAMPLTDADCPVVGTYFSLSSCNFTAALIIASGLQ